MLGLHQASDILKRMTFGEIERVDLVSVGSPIFRHGWVLCSQEKLQNRWYARLSLQVQVSTFQLPEANVAYMGFSLYCRCDMKTVLNESVGIAEEKVIR